MGSRVTPRQTANSHSSTNKSGHSFFLQNFLKTFASFLTYIGTPFYYLLTWAIITVFSLIWFVGETVITFLEKLFSIPQVVIQYLLSVEKNIQKSFNINKKLLLKKRKALRIPKLKPAKPQINLSIPQFSFSLPKLKWSNPFTQLLNYSITFPTLPSLPTFSIPRLRIPRFLKSFFVILAPAFFVSLGFWILVLKDLPKPGALATRDQIVSTKIYDKNGELLFKIYRNENRTLVPLKDIPEHVKNATIAIEDDSFYSHPGVSIRGITRAFYKNYTQGKLTGGSTITQQLIKNTLLTPEKTFTRKVKEVVLSVQTELTFTKDEILEMYFNEVGYGGAAYGIEEASQLYFGKQVQDLSLAEASILAGLPKAPTTYSPFGAYPDLAKQRQQEVLNKMVTEGYISQIEADAAFEEELFFTPQRTDIKAPHFVMYVKQLLAERYGERAVEEGGLEVYTTLDLNVQDMAEKIVREETEKIKHLRIGNGAALITEPKTGAVLAMVGSKDYFDAKGDGNYNVTTALRQPGSSIKPINYSYALENKLYTAASLISDSPITYHTAGSEPYTPHNYDSKFRGNVTLRTALGSSLNVTAVKVLASYGVRNMIAHAQKMGITTWEDPSRFGLSLTLGGGEVKMTDMNVAYGVFANDGQRVPLNPILKVTNYKGQTLEQESCTGKSPEKFVWLFVPIAQAAEYALNVNCAVQALNPKVAFIITDILRDNIARTPVFGPRSLLVIPNHPEVAVKTGTTQNLRDNWVAGYTQDFVVITWVGNNNNMPMSYVASGITGATPIWHKIMVNLLKDKESKTWEIPIGIIMTDICPRTGSLPCEGCGGKKEYFLPGTEPKNRCVPKPVEEKVEDNKTVI